MRQRSDILKLAPLVVLVLMAAGLMTPVSARKLHSFALVRADASLSVEGKTVHLFGIHLPPSGRDCRTYIRPVRCGSRAALALDFKVQGFVHCFPRSRNRDRSVNAVCFVNRTAFDGGEDLGAYLIERGWAVAAPEAPYAYHVLEEIARHHNRGIWGLSSANVRQSR